MEGFKLILESRMRDRNPFREMLVRMGAFGGPNLQELGGVGQQAAGGQPPVPSQETGDIRHLVGELIKRGVPEQQAVQMAQKIALQQQNRSGVLPDGG
jgi:hypothetical protein